MMGNYKRLHIVSVLSEFMKGIQRLVIPAIFAFLVGQTKEQSFFQYEYSNLIIIGFLTLAVIYGFYRWVTFHYKINDQEIHVRKGLIIKNDIFIPKDKIKSIDSSRSVIPRLFGLVQLKIKFEGIEENNPEINLIAIAKEEAATIQNLLIENKRIVGDVNIPSFKSVKLSKRELLLSALTSNHFITGFVTIVALFYNFNSQLNQKIGVPSFASLLELNPILQIAWFGVLILLAWMLSIVRTIIRFNQFKLSANGEKISIQRGLFEKKEMIISKKDIRAIRIEESILRQLFGYACIYLETSSGDIDKRSVATVLHPFVRLSNVEKFLESFALPYPSLIPVHSLPKPSRLRYVFRKFLLGITLSAILFIKSFEIANFLFIPVILLSILWGFFQYKDTSYGFSNNYFLLKRRFFNRNTIIFERKQIETIYFYESWFQRKRGVKSLGITILSNISKKKYKLVDFIGTHESDIHQWYRKSISNRFKS